MVFDYTPFLNSAQALIEQYGRKVALIQRSRTAADPDRPWRGQTSDDVILRDVPAVFTEFTEEEVDGTNSILIGDLKVLIAAKEVEGYDLELFDELSDGRGVWEIVTLM